jgi:hypothetical protein
MSGSRRGRLAAASYTGLALSVISAIAVPAVAATGGDGSAPAEPPTYRLPAPPAAIAFVAPPEPVVAPTPPPPPTVSAPAPTAAPVPKAHGTVRALSAQPVAYTPPQPGDPPDSDFDRLAQCESSSRWNLNTGNGYYGGLQFSASTWQAYGGPGLPHEHSREDQIEIARRVWRARGWSPWPSCSRSTGLR